MKLTPAASQYCNSCSKRAGSRSLLSSSPLLSLLWSLCAQGRLLSRCAVQAEADSVARSTGLDHSAALQSLSNDHSLLASQRVEQERAHCSQQQQADRRTRRSDSDARDKHRLEGTRRLDQANRTAVDSSDGKHHHSQHTAHTLSATHPLSRLPLAPIR